MKPRGKKITLLAGVLVLAAVGFVANHYRAHIRFWWQFESIGKNPQGYPEYRHRQTGITFVKLPGGTFWMGAQAEDAEGRNYDPDADTEEGSVHEVAVSPFLIAKYEVTQAEWKMVMGSNPSSFQPGGEYVHDLSADIPVSETTDDWPVEKVSWDDCREFCRETGLRLPTEAEWEYACRAGSDRPFAGNGKIDNMGWFSKNSGGRPHAVGEKQPNGFGIHDMHGNVWEWCEDVFDEDFYSKPKASRKDPRSASGSVYRVYRGGCWGFDAGGGGSAVRSRLGPSLHSRYLGFRPSGPSLP